MSALKKLVLSLVAAAVLFTGAAARPAAAAAAPAGLHGPQPFLTVLCKVAGVDAEPESPAFFEQMLLGPAPSLDHYWREVSYGEINLSGSRVTTWRTIEGTAASFRDAQGKDDLIRLADACLATVTDEMAGARYAGFNLVFNANLDKRPWGGAACHDENGTRVCRHATWIWPNSMHKLASWAHEMGHAFGLPHSAGAQGMAYEDTWSLMSDSASCRCGIDHTSFPQHLSGQDKDRLGWIPAARRFVMSSAGTRTVTLERIALPSPTGALLAVIPWGDARGSYYTVEARGRAGYDAHLPGAAVVIHSVDPRDLQNGVHLVAHPGDTRTNGAEAAWLPGASFTDRVHSISVTVESGTARGFVVTIRRGQDAARFIASLDRQPAVRFATARRGGPATPTPGPMLPAGAVPTPKAGLTKIAGAAGASYTAWIEQKPRGGNVRFALGAGDAGEQVNDVNDDAWRATPAIAADAQGNVYAAWVDARSGHDEVFTASRSADGTWSKNRPLAASATEAQAAPALAVDGAGNVYAVWVSYSTCGRGNGSLGSIWAAYKSAGGEWQPARVVAPYVDGGREVIPALEVSGGRVTVTWQAYEAGRLAEFSAEM